MKTIAIISSFVILLMCSSCHPTKSNGGHHPLIGITFSGTVTEDAHLTPAIKFSILDATNANATGTSVNSAVDGTYNIGTNAPDHVETMCAPPSASDAPLVFLYLDLPATTTVIVEDFKFTSHSTRTTHLLTVKVPSGGYRVRLRDNTAPAQVFTDFIATDAIRTGSFTINNIAHRSLTFTLISPTAGAQPKVLPFTLPDLNTGAVVSTSFNAF